MMEGPHWKASDAPLKVFIRDIHGMTRDPNDLNFYHFGCKRVRKVDIMGVVTEVRHLRDCHLYRVDDGTGEILCRHNHDTIYNQEELKEIEDLQDAVAEINFAQPSVSGAAMEYILEESYKICKKHMTLLQQGDCAHLQGFISTYHDNREVCSYRLFKVSEHAHELDRIFELSALYSKVYSKFTKS